MLRIFVDSGASLTTEERQRYGVDLLPVTVEMGDHTWLDGVDLPRDTFYRLLTHDRIFPKTALPAPAHALDLAERYLRQGDEVLILCLSSDLSGTCQSLSMLFADEPRVTVVDTRLAVGGIRFLVREARRWDSLPVADIVDKLQALIPRIRLLACPDTLDFLLAGGRLTKAAWMVGSMLQLRPVLCFREGSLAVAAKKRGTKQAMQYIAETLAAEGVDPHYGIVASYTGQRENLDKLLGMLPPALRQWVTEFDDVCPTIGCHWGPNGYGLVYVAKE